jgi:hypothetical protein
LTRISHDRANLYLELAMWILIAAIAAGALAHLWRQWRALLRQLPDCAEHLVLF